MKELNRAIELLRFAMIRYLSGATMVSVPVMADFDIELDRELKRMGFVEGLVKVADSRQMGYRRGFVSVAITKDSVIISHDIQGSALESIDVKNPIHTIRQWVKYMDRI